MKKHVSFPSDLWLLVIGGLVGSTRSRIAPIRLLPLLVLLVVAGVSSVAVVTWTGTAQAVPGPALPLSLVVSGAGESFPACDCESRRTLSRFPS